MFELLTKECTGCGLILDIKQFRVRIQHNREYIVARCKDCEHMFNKIQQDPEKKRAAERKRFSDPERRKRKNEFQKEWRSKNIEKNREYHKKNIKKNVDELTDLYIKRTVNKKNPHDVPEDLVELKRAQLEFKRIIKIIEDERKGNTVFVG